MNSSLESLGEVAVIRRLTACLTHGADVLVGPGDDCAVVALPGGDTDLVLTSDPVIEGSHFTRGTPPRQVGHKAIGRVLSDLAAMGATPRWAIVDVVAPPDMNIGELEEAYGGMQALARTHGLAIIGGDVARGTPFALHLFATGTIPSGRACLRSGAAPGQAIFVTGELGGSFSGKHLTFAPRVAEGIWLRDWATAMMDLSDGLASDLRHLCSRSRVGARIDERALPVSSAAAASHDGRTPIEHALEDGEDFELLFTVPANRTDAFNTAWASRMPLRCTQIGVTTRAEDGIVCITTEGDDQPLENRGYDHFAG